MVEGTILLIEDDQDDIFFMRHALKKAGIENWIQVAEDGQEAIDYLSGEGKYADRSVYPLPVLILLDLKLPRRNGLEVLECVRAQTELSSLAVIVLTSSSHHKDVDSAARLGVNSFLVKPSNIEDLSELMMLVKRYWLEFDQLTARAQEGSFSGDRENRY